MTTGDVHGSLTAYRFSTDGVIVRSCCMIGELIWPTEAEAVRQTFMLRHVRKVSVFVTDEVYQTDGCQFTTAIDILANRTAFDIHNGITRHCAIPKHRCERVIQISITTNLDCRFMLVIIAAFSSTIDAAPDVGTSGNRHFGLVTHNTVFSTAIDILLNRTATDIDRSSLRSRYLRPQFVKISIELRVTSHAGAKDIAAILSSQNVVTNSTTANVDSDMTVCDRIAFFIIYQLTVRRIVSRCKVNANRCQTATAVDRTQHRTVSYIHFSISASATGCQRQTAETTTAAEDVTIDV